MTPQDYLGLALVYAIIGLSLAAALAMERNGSGADARKAVHIGVGLFVLVWWMFSENWIMLVFFTVPFAVILFVTMLRDNALSDSRLGDLANRDGHRTGLFLYAVSITVLVALFWDHWSAATVGVVAMTWGDGVGSLVGRRFGKHPMINGKSLEGSLAVFAATAVASFLVLAFYGWLISSGLYPAGDVTATVPLWTASLLAGALASVLEALCPGQYDNIVIPLVVATVMALLGL